jgi:hypothetical protein
MHVYMRLIQLFPFTILLNGGFGGNVPAGFSRVITKRNTFVVTGRGNSVIAKQYV